MIYQYFICLCLFSSTSKLLIRQIDSILFVYIKQTMNDNYSPSLFLFQSYVLEVIKEGKKHIKTAPFDIVDPETLFSNDKSQSLDLYHTYFLSAMGHIRTREIACLNYEKLLKQSLVDKERLPSTLISSILTACANVGGSTSGSSSLGSASLNSNPQNLNHNIGNLIRSILLFTYQPASELTVGLNYLLQGTRKKHSLHYATLLEQVYNDLLVRYRRSAVSRFVSGYLNTLIDQVEAFIDYPSHRFATRQIDEQTGKMDIPVYVQSYTIGKYGRCFLCRKQAGHYMKEQYLPICSIICKQKLKQLITQTRAVEQFNLLGWIIQNLHGGDQIIFRFLARELEASLQYRSLSYSQLVHIIKSFSGHMDSNNSAKLTLPSLALIVTSWEGMIPLHEFTPDRRQLLQFYFKTLYLEILIIIEDLPISKDQFTYIQFFIDILKHQPTFFTIFNRYDARFFQPNILGRMLNILSQYSRKYEIATKGLESIVRMLVKKYFQGKQHPQQWLLAAECSKKRELKKVITLFNKKPLHGIKYLKKIFEQEKKEELKSKDNISELEDSPIKSYQSMQNNQNQTVITSQIISSFNEKDKEIEKIQAVQIDPQAIEEENLPKEEKQSQKIGQQQEFQEPIQEWPPSLSQQSSQISYNSKQPEKIQLQPSTKKKSLNPFHIALFLRQFSQPNVSRPLDSQIPITLPLLQQPKVGQYFGMDNNQIRKVCLAYLSTFNFQDYQIDDMMRMILNSFSLPKQTQMVDRLIGDIAKRLEGHYGFNNDTQSYQYFYLLLMVQTTNHNPNVRESERLKLDSFLKMCQSMINRIPQKAQSDYKRIIDHSLNCKIKYSQESYFSQKYLGELERYSDELFPKEEGSEAKHILSYIWEFLVIGLVWPGNSKGLFESIILFGREDFAAEQRSFFQALRKQSPLQNSRDAILRISIDYGNQLHGDLWNTVISLIYKIENENELNSAVLDKLFTNSCKLNPLRLKDFIRSLLQFSKSQIRSDSYYTRELFVLRHINSLLQYNIPRFWEVAQQVWPILQEYFKDICLHPKKQVSMAAIDSLKQLVLKLLKLHEDAVPHQALMQTFLHIFERSCLQMKDLIANILLNLITSDLRDGWQSIYQILDVLDTKDKQLVIRILDRLIGQVGMARLTNLTRLHSICIKELRICNESNIVQQLLSRLWELSQYINDPTVWLESIRSIKDIFKISLNNDLLQVLIRMCNRCLSEQFADIPDRSIFDQIVDFLMFLLDFKGGQNKTVGILLTSLQTFKETNVDFLVKYLGGSFGFLSIFHLYLYSEMKIPFALFLKNYFTQFILPALKQQKYSSQLQHFSLWCINFYYDCLPLQLINLRQKDKDFDITLQSFINKRQQVSQKQQNSELIQFHLSHKEYKQKSILHLIFLDIIQQIYKATQTEKVRAKVEESVIDSYQQAVRINKLIILRHFLWRNGFLGGKILPGLHKQEHRTFSLILSQFPFEKSYPLIKQFIANYLYTTSIHSKLTAKQPPEPSKDFKKQKSSQQKQLNSLQKQVKNLQTYINDTQAWITQAHKLICQSWIQIRWQASKSDCSLTHNQLTQLVGLALTMLDMKTIPISVCHESAQTLKSLYQVLI